MVVLVLNCGSSSIKYSLFSIGSEEKRLVSGSIDRIGFHDSRVILESSGSRVEYMQEVRDHSHAIDVLTHILNTFDLYSEGLGLDGNRLGSNGNGLYSILPGRDGSTALPSFGHIDSVGHRVVHGGDKFSSAVKIDEGVLKYLKANLHLAPLHNPPNLAGITAISSLLPDVPQVAVFDTAFHQTLPPHAYFYALPYELYEKHRIRRYGFHGLSHRFVAQETSRILKRPAEELRLITCHLGNGSSMAAVKNGRSVDTTMGFTPLEGLAMGTRCGDIDPAIVLFLQEKLGKSLEEVSDLLNKKSGMAGLSCFSSDMREILKAVYANGRDGILNADHPNHDKSKLALDAYIYKVKKYIGAYAAAMGGVDAIVFTGGIGQNLSAIQEMACSELEFMGVDMGPPRSLDGKCYCLSKPSSRVNVLAMPTDEELIIARETGRTLRVAENL